MVQSLQLGSVRDAQAHTIRRLNRLPVLIAIALVVLFFAVIIFGLSARGFLGRQRADDKGTVASASNYADQLKRGVKDGIIGEPDATEGLLPPPVVEKPPEAVKTSEQATAVRAAPEATRSEPEAEFEARLAREGRERYLREVERRKIARLQAAETALDSPLAVDVSKVPMSRDQAETTRRDTENQADALSLGLSQAAQKAGFFGQNGDANRQILKEDFFNQDIKKLGYLPNHVVPQVSLFELKRGSVVPATLISGISSDLPGRISAQVSQNVYDSATGDRLLIPQGAKLFGRYDSKISFGQARVLVVWTDIIFPNGQTLQIGGMAGTDAQGYGGFKDRVNNHIARTFASAALIALVGTGIDASMPESSTRQTQDTASDASRRNFAESFGRVAEKSIDKTLDVQPTLEIRPGYLFNILVDQDIVFPGVYPGH